MAERLVVTFGETSVFGVPDQADLRVVPLHELHGIIAGMVVCHDNPDSGRLGAFDEPGQETFQEGFPVPIEDDDRRFCFLFHVFSLFACTGPDAEVALGPWNGQEILQR